jgi:hypothetical protein
MPLAEKLLSASQKHKQAQTTCKLVSLTLNPKVPKEDRDALARIIDLTEDHEEYIPNATLCKLIVSEGYDMSPSAVDRHRRGTCSCRRLGK